MFRKRYSSILALILSFVAILVASEHQYVWSAIIFTIAWFYGTEVDENPEIMIGFGEMTREVLRMLPVQAIVVSLIYVLGYFVIQHLWGLYVLTTFWFFGSFFLPLWISGNKHWYLENHLLVSVGYWLFCLACWVWIGPLVITLLF